MGFRAESPLEHRVFVAVLAYSTMAAFVEPIGFLLAFHHQTGNCAARWNRSPMTVLQGCGRYEVTGQALIRKGGTWGRR